MEIIISYFIPSTVNFVAVQSNRSQFDDELMRSGAEGGIEAARLLFESVKTHLRGLDDGTDSAYAGANEWRVMVRVYANFSGLSTALTRVGIHKSANDLIIFSSGFTRGQPLFDFVNAGDEKEGADHKIRGKESSSATRCHVE